MSKATVNLLLCGLAFHFISISFTVVANTLQFDFVSIRKDDPNYRGNAHLSMCITFTSATIFSIFSSFFTRILGVKTVMFLYGAAQFAYTAHFFYPVVQILYLINILCGFGNGTSTIAQSWYVKGNSTTENLTRNMGIFTVIIHAARLTGMIYVYLRFNNFGLRYYERMELFAVMSAMCAVGCVLIIALPPPVYPKIVIHLSALDYIKTSVKLIVQEKDIVLLAPSFFHNGLQFAFLCSIYTSCLAMTKAFARPQMQLIALGAIPISVGQIITGMAFGTFSQKTVRLKRCCVLTFGVMLHIFAVALIMVNLPCSSIKGETEDIGLIKPNVILAAFCGLLLGLAEACCSTQIIGFLEMRFSEVTTQAHTVFRIFFCFGVGAGFFFSLSLSFHAICSLLIILGVASAATFTLAECKSVFRPKEEQLDIEEYKI